MGRGSEAPGLRYGRRPGARHVRLGQRIKDQEEREAFFAHIIKSESHRAITAMMSLQNQTAWWRCPDDFDADPWTLTVLNGTIDLRTGKLGSRTIRTSSRRWRLSPTILTRGVPTGWFLSMVMNQRSRLVTFCSAHSAVVSPA